MNALTLGLVAALCWGIHDITIRYLSARVPLMAALLVVLFVGALFQTTMVTLSGEPLALSRQALALSIGSGLAFLTASLGLYFAFQRGPVRLVSPIIASYPIITMVLTVASGAHVTLFQGIAVLAIVIGVGLVAALSDDDPGSTPAAGPTILLSIIAACGFAGTFEMGQMAANLAGELPTTLVARLTALSLLVLILVIRRAPLWPGKAALLPLAIMGLLDGVALISVMAAAPLPNPEYAAVASSVFGLLTVVLAWAFLRERMSPPQWLGCLIAFAGIGYLAL